MLTVTGVLLIIGCIRIYNIGERPFTPTNIAAEFSKISVAVWITLALVIAGAIFELILPREKIKPRASVDKKALLSRRIAGIDQNDLSDETAQKLKKEQTLCKTLRILAPSLITVAAIPAIIYSLNFENFGADYNASVIAACTLILPLTFVCMGIAAAYLFITEASIERRLALTKTLSGKIRKSQSTTTVSKKALNPTVLTVIRASVAALAILLIILGIFNGGMADVLSKAVNICTECIGLG